MMFRLLLGGVFLMLGISCSATESLSVSKGYQKPGAPVRLVAEPIVGAEPGQTLALKYRFFAPAYTGAAKVQLHVDPGLNHNGSSYYEFDLQADEFAIELEATAAEAGIYYVRFTVEMGGQFRALGQRVQIGEVTTQSLQKTEGVVGGIMSMPANETIKRK